MTTRLYLTNHAPPFQPALKGAWDTSTAVVYRELGARDGPISSVSQAETSTNTAWDMALLVLMARIDFSGDLPVGSGVIDVRYGRLANTASSFVAHYHIWVSNGSTSTVRHTIVADGIGAANWLTTGVFSFISINVTPSALACTAGDYLIIELGARGITASGTSRTASLYYAGLTGPDPVTDDAVTGQAGWVDMVGTAETLFTRPPISGTPLMAA